MEYLKILLIQPENRNASIEFGDEPWVTEPLALEYLSAGLKQDSHEVRILDLRLNPNGLNTALNELQPDVAGITGYSVSVLSNLATCARIKEILPTCRTVIGGHHATMMSEDFFEPQVDFIINGEGVFPLKELARKLTRTESPNGIPGVFYRSNGCFENGGPPAPVDLDDLPFPDRTITGGDREFYYIEWNKKPIALLRSTAGCAFRCSFCTTWKEYNGKYLIRKAERIVQELQQIREDRILLVDDEPFLNSAYMARLAEAIKRAGIKKDFYGYCRVDSMVKNPELMRAWREIGLTIVFMGIEAITDKELTDYNKRIELNQIDEALRMGKDLGIFIKSGFIVDPNYQVKDFRRLERFIERHQIENPSFTVSTPLPGSDDLKTFDRITEFQPNGRPNWDLWDLKRPVVPTALPKEQFMREFENLKSKFDTDQGQFHFITRSSF